MSIAVVIPTIRPESYTAFEKAWSPLFRKHGVAILKVQDGPDPTLYHYYAGEQAAGRMSVADIMGDDADLICNFSPAVRNLGFAYIARYMLTANVIITLDDDVTPRGDPIQDHLDALNQHVPVTWFNTLAGDGLYPRGFPRNVRDEAEVVLSHGVWHGVADWDAFTQFVLGNPLTGYHRIAIPKGVEVPICGMNIAFKRKVLPLVYYAPVCREAGCQRFDDIWWGRHFKRAIDEAGLAMVTGYAAVNHDRASNVFKNLVHEAVGVGLNEDYWSHQDEPFFVAYAEKRRRWCEFIEGAKP